ncbi:transcriptional regulator [Sphaerisporangium krabiense]|uniref:Transcriptional regulator with XRE-family HTH domain n=1 Tax=Sphaerisporangium krabiense TaxID=763782 RepID=A0A7W8ZBT1_9ACTN|nr:helix-turn-helix transcriptional regulator [Sphaerisporangium krabiense]MBB5631137.1 transcriptional regulator with XRE-family HTH domain [Sphaerisporangium krabiense]GII61252.1 transcriptional regulator [Sphaerisporangium krabiense]
MAAVEREEGALGGFLRSRRARLCPKDVGIDADSGRRRVPGLRREELARLAGVSVEYYTRLEQGRSRNASHEVLDAIADALRLDETERAYMRHLSRPARARRPGRPAPPQRVPPTAVRLLEVLEAAGAPATVIGRRTDILAANRLTRALIADFDRIPARDRNVARFVFLDPRAPGLYGDWRGVARHVAALPHFDAGRHPEDPLTRALVRELLDRSEDFRRAWAAHDVHERVYGVTSYRNRIVGDVELTYQALSLPEDSDQRIFVYTAEPGSPSETAMRALARWVQDGGLTGPAPA